MEKDRWNLEDIYQNQDEWEKDIGKVEMLLSEAGDYYIETEN